MAHHKESLRDIMADPEMHQLSDTWMGAFYTNPPNVKRKSPEAARKKSTKRNPKYRIPDTIPEVTLDQALTGSINHEEKILQNNASQDFIKKMNMDKTMSNFS